ncbi:11238_t:CDS:2 [Gigaspora margarita]|uniref:11238_t:CDS:1 n=1 Tax=Gigaspora margarita TaxID=4874 RepID=A0ABM8W0B0_GIGMA|nr:11238_t:CDS:2 [Gigaspora margarita]
MTAPTQKETNILLLGETGVGKSTFINAFYNYLRFDTLNEALSENMEVLIPSKFTITDENYEYKTIKIGNNDDSNEEFDNTGMSATQTCREYKFDLGDMIVRLIDSPGIGDTRGIDKDKENFDNILKFISHYEYLNGICILLKPNNARLTVLFRFCIQELLSHLHKSAKDNIVFCFTNCRGTLYRPGDTLPALQEELRKLEQRSGVEIKTKKDTMYCFDNESFRFLAASKGGVRFEEMDETNFTKSWERSVEESVRLLKYICFLNPHQVQDTLTLNEARKIVILLAKPIANIEQLIQININLIKDRQNEINSCTKSIRDLNKRLYVPQKALEPKQLGYPRTICTNCNTEVVDNKINYKSHCHPHCYLNGVSVEVVNNVALLKCAAIRRDDGICYECGCSYKVHMHITYDVDYITIKVVDKTVEEQIKNKKTFREQKEIALKNCEKLRKQQESEKKKITEINIKFAQFLRQSAIATFNDTYAEYLDHFIREEKIKKSHDPANYNDAIIEGLEETRNEYLTKIEIIKKAIATNDPTNKLITPEDIKSYEEELYSLKINGAALKEMKSLAERGQLIVFKQYQSKISNYKSARKSSSKIFNRIFNGFRSKDDYPNCSDSRCG